MYAQVALPFPEMSPNVGALHVSETPPLYPRTQAANEADNRKGLCEPGSPKFIRSVVAEAGLGRFVYMFGLSGRRYVFSPISAEQAGLYDQAIFAHSDEAGMVSGFETNIAGVAEHDGLYVHLLADDEGTGRDVINDLALAEQA